MDTSPDVYSQTANSGLSEFRTRSSVTLSAPDFAALGEPRQRLRWHAALCDRSLESSSSAAHTLCTVGTAYCAAATVVTVSDGLALTGPQSLVLRLV